MFIQWEEDRCEARDFTASLPYREFKLTSKCLKFEKQWKDKTDHDDCQISL